MMGDLSEYSIEKSCFIDNELHLNIFSTKNTVLTDRNFIATKRDVKNSMLAMDFSMDFSDC